MIARSLLALGLVAALALPIRAQDASDVLVIEVAGAANGAVEIELLPDVAPRHVERIKTLAREGAYDGVAFHRVIDGFMAQTGDVEFGGRDTYSGGRAGAGGSALPDLPAEVSDLSFEAGVLGMARGPSLDSANSQFFIMFAPAPHLDGQYTVVGRVIGGQEVVDAIKRGDPATGAVDEPDYMSRVYLKDEAG